MSTILVRAVDLRLAYARRRVLDSVSLDISAGESTVIMGRSGSGKTTLLLALAGLLVPTGGRVEITTDSVMYVPQAPSLLPELTAWQNVVLAQRLHGTPPAQAGQRATTELQALGLADAADLLPFQLSGGMAARTALARALALDPAAVLVDEPTGSLDAATGAMVIDLLVDRAAAGAALVVSTHDRGVAQRLAGAGARTLVLADGRLAA